MRIHFCALEDDERDVFMNRRLHRFHIQTKRGNLGIAYLRSGRFVQRYADGKWLDSNWYNWQSWVHWIPADHAS